MDCILIKKNYNIDKLKKDILIATKDYNFINPNNYTKSFSLSKDTIGWEAIPLNTINGTLGNQSTIPVEIADKKFQPNEILLKCRYFQEILKELNTDVYLVRLMKLKKNGYIAPHKDKLIKNDTIRCQIPIITNPKVEFYIGNEEKKKYYLEAGNLYYLNVGNSEHYVINKSNQDRLSLIIDMKKPKYIESLINKTKVS